MIYIADGLQVTLGGMKHSPPQALLLTGPAGRGLMALAKDLASQWGSLEHIVQPTSAKTGSVATISAESVRELYTQTRGSAKAATFVIIDDADTMSASAQNALLKLLEEPSKSTHFILTTHIPEKLLQTVQSRCQLVSVPPISQKQSLDLLVEYNVTEAKQQRQMLYIAEGNPAELHRLATNDEYFRSISSQIEQVKQFVIGDTYKRLTVLLAYSASRQQCLQFIDILLNVLHRLVISKPEANYISQIDKLLAMREAIEANGNVRLQIAASVV